MIGGQRVVVVMPAFNAGGTLERTWREVIAQEVVDLVIIVDDASRDDTKVSEFHTGYRAFSRRLLEQLPLRENSDDFVFDNEILAEAAWCGYVIGEVSCPTRYAPDASSINFARSVRYGFGCLATARVFRLCRWGLASSRRFPPEAVTRS